MFKCRAANKDITLYVIQSLLSFPVTLANVHSIFFTSSSLHQKPELVNKFSLSVEAYHNQNINKDNEADLSGLKSKYR